MEVDQETKGHVQQLHVTLATVPLDRQDVTDGLQLNEKTTIGEQIELQLGT